MVRGNRQWLGLLSDLDAKLVPVFNCNPPADLGQTCEPQAHDGTMVSYISDDHRGILVYDPQSKNNLPHWYTYRNQLFKGPTTLISMLANLFFTDPWGIGPGPNLSDATGAVYQYSKDGVLRWVMDSGMFPEWHRRVAG